MQCHIAKIWTGKTFREHIFCTKCQTLLNIFDNTQSSTSGQCQDGNFWMCFSQICQLQIRRTKIVTPLRDTVRLINSKQIDFHVLYTLTYYIRIKALWSNVEEFYLSKYAIVQSNIHFTVIHT